MLCASLWLLVDYRVGEGVVGADAQGEGTDGGAGVALLFFSEQGPGEGYRTFKIVGQSFVTHRAIVDGELEHHVELRQQRDDEFNAFLLLF